jgi:hypothetical protein
MGFVDLPAPARDHIKLARAPTARIGVDNRRNRYGAGFQLTPTGRLELVPAPTPAASLHARVSACPVEGR